MTQFWLMAKKKTKAPNRPFGDQCIAVCQREISSKKKKKKSSIFIQLINTWPPSSLHDPILVIGKKIKNTESTFWGPVHCCLSKRNLFKKIKKNLVSSSNSFNSLTRGPPRGGISCTRHICRVQDIQNPLGKPHAFVKEKSLPKKKKTKI